MTRRGRRSGGRPRVKERRDCKCYYIYVTCNERDKIEAMALAAGLRPAGYLRAVGLNKSISWRVNAAAARELRRIGVNLNQLARAANREGALE